MVISIDDLAGETPIPSPIPVSLFERQENKTTQLINNQSIEFFVEGRHRWYEFKFEEPIYVTNIQVTATGYDSWNDVSYELFCLDGNKESQSVKFSGSETSYSHSKVVTGFRFRPDAKWGSEEGRAVKSVIVTGLNLKDFHRLEAKLYQIEKYKQEAIAVESKAASDAVILRSNAETLTGEITNSRDEIRSLESLIGINTAQLDELKRSIESERVIDQNQKSALADIQSQLTGYQDERRTLQAEISEKTNSLQSLTREVRLFPSEISGFVREGDRSIRHFIYLSIPFTAIILYVAYALFSSSIDLTQLWRRQPDIEVWTVFLTRLPFVLVSITILEVCGFIIGRFIFEILKINRQRLSLSKLSIIAKDVSAASSYGSEFSEDEVFEKEARLKMELLKEHMKEYVSDSFEYKGTAVTSAIKAVARRLSKSASTPSE